MANTLYTRAFTGNKEVYKIEMKTFWQGLRSQFWYPFIGMSTPKGRMIEPLETSARPVENPIVMHRELIRKMGDIVQVPIMRQLKAMPKEGDAQLKEQEERFFVNHMEVPVDTMRHAALPYEGKMMRQNTKDLDLVNQAQPGLRDHFSRCLEYLQPSYAMYYGYSHNILAGNPRWSSHSYIKTISHPNIFAPGLANGNLTFSAGSGPSTSAWETAVAGVINGISSSDILTGATLQALTKHPKIRRIDPLIMKGGRKLRFLVLHPFQVATLEQDDDFKAMAQSPTELMIKNNPILMAADYIYGGWAIYQSDTAIWPARVTSSLPEFGPTGINATTYSGNLDTFESYGSDTVFAGMILGRNSIGMAVASGLEFVNRMDDYGHILGLGWDIIVGASRGDYYNRDDGTLGDNVINDGSALLFSYAPQPAL